LARYILKPVHHKGMVMEENTGGLLRVLTLIEKAHAALAEAATILRELLNTTT
jgi:hypothetical protein